MVPSRLAFSSDTIGCIRTSDQFRFHPIPVRQQPPDLYILLSSMVSSFRGMRAPNACTLSMCVAVGRIKYGRVLLAILMAVLFSLSRLFESLKRLDCDPAVKA